MRCMKCGTVIPNGGTVCPHCGNDASARESSEVMEDVQQETADSVSEDRPLVQAPESFSPKAQNEKALFDSIGKLVFFSALLSAFSNLKSAYEFLTGAGYRQSGVSPEEIYGYYGPSLEYLDKSVGIFSLLFAIFYIVAAIAIHKKKKYAGVMILSIIAVSFVVTVTYNVLLTVLFGAEFNSMVFVGIGTKIVWFALLFSYFKKFKNQYVN